MSSEADNWKWWYFVVAGVLIGAFGIYEFYTWRIGSEILAVLCIAIGLFSRSAEIRRAESNDTESQE